MKTGRPSATARLIAAATVYAQHEFPEIVPVSAADLCRCWLATSRADRCLLWILDRRPGRAAARLLERATLPGIVAHFMARKRWIEERARIALNSGVSQVVVVGAGLDTLATRLAPHFPDARFIEIDHPATQSIKRRAGRPESVQLVPADLSRTPLREIIASLDQTRPSIVIAEGLLMYLSPAEVDAVLLALASWRVPHMQLLFTFMEATPGAAVGFSPRSRLVDWWLAARREPFKWFIDPRELGPFLQSRGFRLVESTSQVAPPGVVRGEFFAAAVRPTEAAEP